MASHEAWQEPLSLTLIPSTIRDDRNTDVVFIHGLGDGDANAWLARNENNSRWPGWIAEDFADVQVWVVSYRAAKFRVGGTAMALPDRALSILSYLVDNRIGEKPILFVAHSQGGLIVKLLLRHSQLGGDNRLSIVAQRTIGVVFLATPHRGSGLATLVNRIGLASKSTAGLELDDPWLVELDNWYRGTVGRWHNRTFFETLPTGPTIIVSRSSADPHTAGETAIPLDANHFDISKPVSRKSPVYAAIKRFIETHHENAQSTRVGPEIILSPQQERIQVGLLEQRRRLEEKAEDRKLRLVPKTVGERPSRLVEHFRDREESCNELKRALRDSTTSAIVIVGHAGLGKTALVCKVLAQLEPRDITETDVASSVSGIAYISTRTAGINAERIFLDCARLVGGEREALLSDTWTNPALSVGEKFERLFAELAEGRYIILLDNLEPLLDMHGYISDPQLVTFFETALTARGHATLLVTSRIPVRVSAALSRFLHHIHLESGLPISDCVALLRELDPQRDSPLRRASDDQLGALAVRVHRVPRALELLVSLFADDPFVNLDSVISKAFDIHNVLRSLAGNAYHVLPNDLRYVMQALSVYARPVPAVAIEFMLSETYPNLHVPDALKHLWNVHLISLNRETGRFYLHPVDEDLAYSSLALEGQGGRNYYEKQAAAYYRELRPPGVSIWGIDDLDLYYSEFDHLIKAEAYTDAAALLSDISMYLAWYGYAERLLAMWQRLENRVLGAVLEIHRKFALGHAYHVLGPLDTALRYYTDVIKEARVLGEEEIACDAEGELGSILRRMGQFELSKPYVLKMVSTLSRRGHVEHESRWRSWLSLLYSGTGEFELALESATEALELAKKCKNPGAEGAANNALSALYARQHNNSAALSHGERALVLYEESRARDAVPYIYNTMGIAELQQGRNEAAFANFSVSVEKGREYGQPRIEAIAMLNLALVAYLQGRHEDAANEAKRAQCLMRRIGLVEEEAANVLVDLLESIGYSGTAPVDCVEYFQAARKSIELFSGWG